MITICTSITYRSTAYDVERRPDGTYTGQVRVLRGGVVLRATVRPGEEPGVASSGLAEERHWDCLARALAALGHAVGLREVAS